ncbi:hypothetical protein FRB95_011743 [Tulasnella sp. JGI-2019a]|nr:hypothetical protein FRB95_011743 [Tulasnella sp. JGI-2019a]
MPRPESLQRISPDAEDQDRDDANDVIDERTHKDEILTIELEKRLAALNDRRTKALSHPQGTIKKEPAPPNRVLKPMEVINLTMEDSD